MPPYDVKIIEICVDDCPEEVGASVVNEVTIPFTQAELLTDWTTGHKQSLLCPALERVYLSVCMYVCMYCIAFGGAELLQEDDCASSSSGHFRYRMAWLRVADLLPRCTFDPRGIIRL